MKRKIIGYIWFNGRDCIGIVMTQNEMGEEKAYIGVAKGINEQEDLRYIADWGSHFNVNIAKDLFHESGVYDCNIELV